MAKFYGRLGYIENVETSPGIWEPQETVRFYRGDILRNAYKWQSTAQVNDDLNITNSISIVADDFAYNNFYLLRWVEWHGSKWKIKSVDVQRPRLILTIGDIYKD